MKSEKLFEELESFYHIRKDNCARDTVTEFVKNIDEKGMPVSNYKSYYKKQYKNKKLPKNDKKVLEQFIRYVYLTHAISDRHNKNRRRHIKIYNSLQELKNSTSQKI